MKEYKKPLVEVVEIETEDIITASAGYFTSDTITDKNGKFVTGDYKSDIFGE